MKIILNYLDTGGPGKTALDVYNEILATREPGRRSLVPSFVEDWLTEYAKRGECYHFGIYWWKGKRP